jgi:hypothetical protein
MNGAFQAWRFWNLHSRLELHKCQIRTQQDREEIWMVPSKNAEGERFNFGIGEWDLLGGLAPLYITIFELLEFLAVLRIRSVASQNTSSNTLPRIELREAGHPIDERELAGLRISASGAMLDTGVQNVAGGGFEPPTFGL